MYDTIIIGAGMSGLAAGIRLAYFDRRVCVLERHTTIGGLNSFYRLNGRNYDVGLHAVTNYLPRGERKGPLAKLLRQLRFRWEEFALVPQVESIIAFPGARLRFSNDIELLTSEIQREFPHQVDGFRELQRQILDYDDIDQLSYEGSARELLAQHVTDPLLQEMLLCPLMYYGSAREQDMDVGQFSIMFRSIFLEGLARPLAGVRLILKKLVRKFKALGGELRLNSGVNRLSVRNGRVAEVVLDNGTTLEGHSVLSSAGLCETLRLCDDCSAVDDRQAGQLSFVEAISTLDRQPASLGFSQTAVFFNDSHRFHWRRPDELVDVHSGVICSPNNFAYDRPLPEGMIRVTALADFDRWRGLSEEDYRLEKLRGYERLLASVVRFIPDFRHTIIDTDMFTPMTVRRFTGHLNGAIYGAPRKALDGRTHLKNLFICGTDQGFVGIVGALISGIAMANVHLLRNPA